MGTDISHIVKHDFKLFHDRNASKTYCESILSHLRKELLLGDGDPEWNEMKILDEEDDFLRMKLADYDVTLRLLPDLWEIESYDRFSHIYGRQGAEKRFRCRACTRGKGGMARI